jgi:ABC-2 type transport system permease protein
VTGLTGTGKLVRLVLRRDRVLLPIWILTFTGLMASIVASFQGLFPTAAERQSYADASAADPGFTSLYGPLHGSSLGELTVWRAGFYPVLVAPVALLTVIRHTRTEEETGRRELLGATVVGRHAGLAAALGVTLAATLVLAALVAAALAGQGLPVAGSLAAGLQLAAAGWPFAAVGAVAAQLTSGAGAAAGHRRRQRPVRRRGELAVVAVADRLGPQAPPLRRRAVVGPAPGRRPDRPAGRGGRGSGGAA